MAGRIVIFGATGFTGRLTAEALVRRGGRPVLAGRDRGRLADLATDLGGLDIAVADASRVESIGAVLERGDVLVSTVGPFARLGTPAVQAAIAARADYLDSTGEPAFIREVFERHGPSAQRAGVGLVTAFGYDFVPGNLAGALALARAGGGATRVDVGYFTGGDGGASEGTRASLAGAVLAPGFAWRDGHLRTERGAARVRSFEVDGEQRSGVSVGASEHFTLPRLDARLREVNAYLGWFGPLARPMQAGSALGDIAFRVPGTRAATGALVGRVLTSSGAGPDAAQRAKSTSHVVAQAFAADGSRLADVRVTGGNGYDFTAEMLAWGAEQAREGALTARGALGPVEAFGLEELRAGCAEAGFDVS